MDWWQLPGANRFLSRIVQDLRDGKNIVLYLPEWTPPGLANAIRRLIHQDDWPWHQYDATDGGEEWARPLNFLVSRFIDNPAPGGVCEIATLLDDGDFGGRCIWIEGLNAAQWQAWRPFVTQYAHQCRYLSAFRRTLLLIALTGDVTKQSIDGDICLNHHRLSAYIDPLDMMLYTRAVLSSAKLTALQQRTAVAVIARLALWDPAVADALATEPMSVILEPTPVLQQIGKARGWPITPKLTNQDAWRWGIADQVEGLELHHSAYLATTNRTPEIQQRIWSGQVGIVFPFIEEERQKLLRKLKTQLAIPFETPHGIIDNLLDLEFGHIEAQVHQQRLTVDHATLLMIQKLRRVRNHLSHLEVVPSELLAL